MAAATTQVHQHEPLQAVKQVQQAAAVAAVKPRDPFWLGGMNYHLQDLLPSPADCETLHGRTENRTEDRHIFTTYEE